MTTENDKNRTEQNIHTGGGASIGGNVSVNNGDFVNGTKNVYYSPPPPTAIELLEKGKQLLKAREYQISIDTLKKSIETDPNLAETSYYMALALLRGNRPKLVKLETIKKIETNLQRVIELQPQMGCAYILWALIKYDFYVLSGMHDRSPSYQDLINQKWTMGYLEAQEIITLVNADGNVVLQWLKNQL